jgi:hypothetical protein
MEDQQLNFSTALLAHTAASDPVSFQLSGFKSQVSGFSHE